MVLVAEAESIGLGEWTSARSDHQGEVGGNKRCILSTCILAWSDDAPSHVHPTSISVPHFLRLRYTNTEKVNEIGNIKSTRTLLRTQA